MSVIFQNLNDPVTTLARPLGTNSFIRFLSPSVNKSPDSGIGNTNLNLTHGDTENIAFVVALRFPDGKLVFNTQIGGTWGTEEKIDIVGLFNETGTSIGIRTNEDSYTVTVDGQEVYIFQKRLNEDATGIWYASNNDETVLSNPIIVDVQGV